MNSRRNNPHQARPVDLSFGSLRHIKPKPPLFYDGVPCIEFTQEECEELAEPFKYTLIGKFLAKRPPMRTIRKEFNKFSFISQPNIGLIDEQHIMIKLENEEDFMKIWPQENWLICNAPMNAFKWSMDFHPDPSMVVKADSSLFTYECPGVSTEGQNMRSDVSAKFSDAIQDECHQVSTEAQNMRSDLSAKFSDAIKDINIKLEEQKDDFLSQLKENEMLRNKLKHLADQHALSEEQFSQKLNQKMLELQSADLKIQQYQERSYAEQTQVQLYAEQVAQLLQTEKNLRLQLAADGEKFQQFQDALLNSNEVFETFKQEMEKMSKSIKELRKENEFLKSNCKKSDIALVKLLKQSELMKQQFERVRNQKDKLECLCRSLQAERKNISAG